ncbi:Na+/H+ antiporter subunit E [Megalodesulfovibrio paquesii]
MDEHHHGGDSANGSACNVTGFVLTFILMMITWCILSGFFDSFHLTMGVISSLIVAWGSHDLLFSTPTSVRLQETWRIWLGFPAYFIYLFVEIWKANIYVLKMCFARDVEKVIDPHLITFKTTLRSRLAMVTLANSITLTPGTITVEVDYDGIFTVHAIDEAIAEGLLKTETNEMQARIAKLFGEQ